MMNIGIDSNQNLVYEGTGLYGRALWPSPVITPAKIVFESEGSLIAEKSGGPNIPAGRFREDSYDPIARIRRGRFYFSEGQQPNQWYVQPHSALPLEILEAEQSQLRKSLETFYGNPIWHKYIEGKREQPLVLFGVEERFTTWTIINVEAISTGEDLVTLKARTSLGILPIIDGSKVPEGHHAVVYETLDAFADEVHRSAPVSVIDRAREAVTQCLLVYLEAGPNNAQDLGKLVKQLEQRKLVVAASAANIIGRLHARAKPVEKTRRSLRPVREQDAQLAILCVGTILCELGCADWA